MKSFLSTLFSLKIIVVLGIIGGTMLWVGGTRLMDGQEKAPTEYASVHEIDLEGPKWISVKNCRIDIFKGSSVEEYDNKGIQEVFVPISLEDENSPTQFFLQSSDPALAGPYNELHTLMQEVKGAKTNLSLSESDPAYLEFQKTTLEELKQKLIASKKAATDYIDSKPPLVMSIEGMLNPQFGLSDSQKAQLGSMGETHIIQHNAQPETGVYTWFLVIIGGILSLLAMLSLFGFLMGSGKEA